jgi:modification methylase
VKLNTVYCGKCEEFIPQLYNESIDLAITSPPYNVDLGNNKHNSHGYDIYKDNKEHLQYISDLKNVFKMLKPKMVSGGRVCINIGDAKNGAIPTHSDIIQFMTRELGYLIKTTIIWNKSQIGNRTSWGSFMSPSNPSFPTPFEYILVFCKDTQQKIGKKEYITVNKGEFVENSLALWTIKPETEAQKYGHPAPFPIELPYRLIQQLSYKDDTVLDPYSGSGTTCLAAEMLGRKWIGFEMSKYYTKMSTKRLKKYTDQVRLF